QASVIALQHAPKMPGHGAQRGAQIEIGVNLSSDVEKQLQTFVLGLQLLRSSSQCREIQRVIKGQRDLVRYLRNELDFFLRVGANLLAAKSDHAQFAMRCR